MKRTSLRVAVILVLASLTCFARAAPITLAGELTTDDFLATDLYGTFHYDLYEISNFIASSVLVDLTLQAEEPLTPWLAYWATQVLPVPNWQSPNDLFVSALWLGPVSNPDPGASITVPQFTLSAGSTYQLAVGTFSYNEDGAELGSYNLAVDANGIQINQIPIPPPLGLLALGIAGIVGWRRVGAA